jgi:predicted kinase
MNDLLLFAIVPILLSYKRKKAIERIGIGKKTTSSSSVSKVSDTQEDVSSNFKITSTWTALGLEQPLVIAMVGLPARGKSYLVNMIIRYLKWTGFECKVFNVGSHRRKIGLASADSNFFDSNNAEATRVREEMALSVQESMYEWLHEATDMGRVAIFDATNTTRSRRHTLGLRAKKEKVVLLFVESICNDEKVLARNYQLKLQNEDYKGMPPSVALKDFMNRVVSYEKVYEVFYVLLYILTYYNTFSLIFFLPAK